MKKIITVDGPAGSGKEKISKYIARKYKLYHLDSGILYRRLAYELEKKNIQVSAMYILGFPTDTERTKEVGVSSIWLSIFDLKYPKIVSINPNIAITPGISIPPS